MPFTVPSIIRTAALGAALVLVPSIAAVAAEPASLTQHVSKLKSATVAGHTIRYLEHGEVGDPAVMLIHGIPTSSYLFREVAPRIAEAGYRVIAPDLLGFGASDRPEDATVYTTEARAERLLALADAAGVETFALVLHDVGGITGWKVVEMAPERVSALVATNTMAGLAGVTPAEAVMPIMAQKATPQDVFAPLATPEGAELLARMWLDQGFSGPGTAPEEEVAAFASDIQGAQANYVAFFTQAVPAFMGEEEQRNAALAAYEGPTAIIFGEKDLYFDADVVVPDLQKRMGTPDENVTRIPEAGHFLQLQAPDAYVAALTRFLDTKLGN